MPRKKPKNEWHLYSTGSIFLASAFVVVYFFSGDCLAFGLAIAAVLLFIFGSSEQWKGQPDSIHKYLIIFSALIIVGLLSFNSIYNFFKKLFAINNGFKSNLYEKYI